MTVFLRSKKRLLALMLVGLTFLITIAACETTTPAPTPTPTSTLIPMVILDPIATLDGEATFADFLNFLPPESIRCITDKVGQFSYEQLLSQPLFSETINFDEELPLECLDQDTILSLVIARLAKAAGGLTDMTSICIRETFIDLDVKSLAEITPGDVSSDILGDALGIGIGMLLCLSDEEAAQITAGGILGETGEAGNFSLADLRCLLEVVDVAQIIGLIEAVDSNTTLDLSTSLSVLAALNTCDINLSNLARERQALEQ